MWLGCSIDVECDITTPKQLSVADWLEQVERISTTSLEGETKKPYRPIKDTPCSISSHCVVP